MDTPEQGSPAAQRRTETGKVRVIFAEVLDSEGRVVGHTEVRVIEITPPTIKVKVVRDSNHGEK